MSTTPDTTVAPTLAPAKKVLIYEPREFCMSEVKPGDIFGWEKQPEDASGLAQIFFASSAAVPDPEYPGATDRFSVDGHELTFKVTEEKSNDA